MKLQHHYTQQTKKYNETKPSMSQWDCGSALSLNSLLVRGGASRERVLSHLLNSSFAAAPLILPSSIAVREGTHSLVNPSSSPLFMRGAWGWPGGGRRRGCYRRPYAVSMCWWIKSESAFILLKLPRSCARLSGAACWCAQGGLSRTRLYSKGIRLQVARPLSFAFSIL